MFNTRAYYSEVAERYGRTGGWWVGLEPRNEPERLAGKPAPTILMNGTGQPNAYINDEPPDVNIRDLFRKSFDLR